MSIGEYFITIYKQISMNIWDFKRIRQWTMNRCNCTAPMMIKLLIKKFYIASLKQPIKGLGIKVP